MENTIKRKYNSTPWPVIKTAVNKLVDFVKPTFGPSQNKIIIADEIESYAIDDGVKIASEFGLKDSFEDSVVQLVKSSAKKTNQRVGDGTTGSMILLQGIINAIPDIFDSTKTAQKLREARDEAVKSIRDQAKQITTQEELTQVALVSSNDETMAKMIGEIIHKSGVDGSIAIEESKDFETNYKTTEGVQFDRGYISPYMASDKERQESSQENPDILVFDKAIKVSDIMPFLQKFISAKNNKLLIIAEDYDSEVQDFLVRNRMQGVFDLLAVKSPGYGADKSDMLEDLRILVDQKLTFDAKTNPADILPEHLGCAKKVIVTSNTCTIIEAAGDVKARIEYLKTLTAENKYDEQKIKDRIARLIGGVTVIRVGGMTDEEVKANREKVEDAVNATKAAYKGGVVKGAGQTLASIETSSPVLNIALKAPASVLRENVGASFEIKDDIYDPADVLVAALESSVSIACLLLSTKGIFTKYQEPDDNGTRIEGAF